MTDKIVSRRQFFKKGGALAATSVVGFGLTRTAYASATGSPLTDRGSRLDLKTMQVLFADLQTPLVNLSQTQSPQNIVRAAGVLANVASVLGIPTLFSVVPEGQHAPTLIPELRPFARNDNTILRTPVSPFHHAPTVAALARNDRKTLVIAGFATEAVVLQATLDAIAAGYTVFYTVDAMGSLSARGENAAFDLMERAGAEPVSVLALATRLVNDFVSAPGTQVFSAIQPLLQK